MKTAQDRQIRVFISSTFRDMHAERDHLVTVVFPELRERVEQLGLEFFDVDLRWGVPEKTVDGEQANSWEYCRQWIDRVEPFFVCILGQRYGWVPEPEELKTEEDRQRQQAEPRSITDMEVRHAVLNTNLKRRSYFYLRATDAPATAIEYVDPPPLLRKLEQLKQEIHACGRPVRDYPCAWTGNGFAGLEEFGRRVLNDLWSGVLRDKRYVSKDIWRQALGADPESDAQYRDESQPVPPALAEKLVALAKPAPPSPLDAEQQQMEAFAQTRLHWFQGRTEELKQLIGFINSTDENAPRLAAVVAVPGQGKSALLARLWENVRSSAFRRPEPAEAGTPSAAPGEKPLTRPNGHPLPSDGRGAGGEGGFVIAHFVGATERSASAHNLVERLLGELDRSGITWPAEAQEEGQQPKRDFNSLCLRIAQRLGDYAGERRIVILLDAVNQLSDGHDLHWLPYRLGPGVRVIVSCVEDAPPLGVPASAGSGSSSESRLKAAPDRVNVELQTNEHRVLRALDSRHPAPLHVPLGSLTPEDVYTIVVEYLKEYCKELDREHVDAICGMDQAKNPLYLLVLLGELRTLGGNDMNRIVGERIVALPHDFPDTVALFRWVLQRLEVFGAEAVKWWCLYLPHGRAGMASHELADLLARKLGADAAATALRIQRGLRRHLLRRGAQLDFFHSQLRQAVLEQYGAGAAPAALHREIADYFVACAKGTDPQKAWETDSVRGFSECAYHFTKAGNHDEAATLLTSFPFLLPKLRLGLLQDVFEDYDRACREAPAAVVKRLEIWADFFREKAHILRRGNEEWPAHRILLQLAVEHADHSPLTIGAEQWLADDRCDWFWLQRVPRLPRIQKNPCLAVLEGHTGGVQGALALADGRLLSWSHDKTLRLWDGQSGACLAVLEGHTAEVSGALELSDGRLLSWAGGLGGEDKTLRVWDARSGECLAVLEGHAGSARGTQELADGRILSWSDDKTLRLWDSQGGVCLAVLEGHTNGVSGALELSDGRLLSWAWDDTLRLWDGRSEACLAVLEGHTAGVSGALELSDGRLLSWAGGLGGEDKTLRVWDARSGECLAVLEGHTAQVRGALALVGGRLLSWAEGLSFASPSPDYSLRLWDSRAGIPLAILEGHTDEVKGACALADGRLLSWSSDDTLRLWDGQSGECLAVLQGHTGHGVLGALELAGGRLLSWEVDVITVSRSTAHSLRLRDSHTGTSLAVLEGHTSGVSGAQELVNSRILSWSSDHTLRLWDSHGGTRLAALEGHADWVKGAFALAGGCLLSWANDGALRLWDSQTGACLAVLEEPTDIVGGALALKDGRALSWSEDGTLRLWDVQRGVCLAVLEGHTDVVSGALELSDGRLLSWAWDDTLRLWDGQSGGCLAVLEGHTHWVVGALALSDGRLLSWSLDDTLRVWDGQSGACLALLKGHACGVRGLRELADGRLLSWSGDGTLRLWDSRSGACLAVLEGHTGSVEGALELSDGRLLSWSHDVTLRLWDGQSGACLEIVRENQVPQLHPEWVHARAQAVSPGTVCQDFFVLSTARTSHLRLKAVGPFLAAWHAESDVEARCLLSDGTGVVTQAKGQVYILKLHHGHRRVSLAEAEALLASQGRIQNAER